ncbi:hypothetical protein P7C70_g5282, partial [Phenoliferia sp. Uapishka_3]
MKCIIVGAGMGGLTAATALRQQGYEVVVYERVSELRPAGSGISVWSNGVKVLNSLGLGKEIAKVGGMMESMSYREAKEGETYVELGLQPLYTRVHQRAYPVARTQLQRILLEGAGEKNVHLSSAVVDYTVTPEGVSVTMADGRTDSGDFLVVADGTHSKLRNKICQKVIPRRYAGYVNWNGPVLMSEMTDYVDTDCWTQFVGDGKRVAMMPMGDGGKFYFYFDASPERGPDIPLPTASGYKAELREHFAGWHPAVQRLIDVVDESKIARAEIHDTDPLPTLIDPSGRALLIGDAAHATAPDLGQGGCQAMEDALVVALLLKKECGAGDVKPTAEELVRVVNQYQDIRAARVASLVLRARARAETTHALNGMPETEAWYVELKSETGERIINGLCKTIETMPDIINNVVDHLPEALP